MTREPHRARSGRGGGGWRHRRACRRARGFTLAEALLAAAILSFSVAAIAQAVVAGQMHTYEALHQLRGMTLAEALMEEILAQPWDDPNDTTTPGPEADELDRTMFDNIDDYDGFAEAAGDVADGAGAVYGSKFARFARSVTVVAATKSIAELGGTDIDGQSITVTVTDDRGMTWALTRFVPEPQ